MNAKRAKAIRAAVGYKNQTKTPSPLPFPGVRRLVNFPLVQRNESGNVRHVNRKVKHGRFWVFDVEFQHKPDGTLATDLTPFLKTARHPEDTPRGVYRRIKKLDRKVGGIEKVDWTQVLRDNGVSFKQQGLTSAPQQIPSTEPVQGSEDHPSSGVPTERTDHRVL